MTKIKELINKTIINKTLLILCIISVILILANNIFLGYKVFDFYKQVKNETIEINGIEELEKNVWDYNKYITIPLSIILMIPVIYFSIINYKKYYKKKIFIIPLVIFILGIDGIFNLYIFLLVIYRKYMIRFLNKFQQFRETKQKEISE